MNMFNFAQNPKPAGCWQGVPAQSLITPAKKHTSAYPKPSATIVKLEPSHGQKSQQIFSVIRRLELQPEEDYQSSLQETGIAQNVKQRKLQEKKEKFFNGLILGQINSIAIGDDMKLINKLRPADDCSFEDEYSLSQDEFSALKSNGHVVCKCRKIKCLKMYCECFAGGQYCGQDCKCQECYNNPHNNETRRGILRQLKRKNPESFKLIAVRPHNPLLFKQPKEQTPPVFCRCRRSKQFVHPRIFPSCQKKYCDCLRRNLKCSTLCECSGCENLKQEQLSTEKKEASFPKSVRKTICFK